VGFEIPLLQDRLGDSVKTQRTLVIVSSDAVLLYHFPPGTATATRIVNKSTGLIMSSPISSKRKGRR
jgi:hypothetical protein